MKISPDGTKIQFKSKNPWYEREESGQKCNTVRRITDQDEAQKLVSCLFLLNVIEIVEPVTNQSFERLISDITFYDNRFIFSWRSRE
jgi:hypothetical protein